MHITLESDYAVRIVYCLVQNARRMDAKSIAEATGVSLRFALKILGKLVSGGLVRSFKGAGGGYELAKAPAEISLREVIEEVEGPCALSRCVAEQDYQCNRNRDACGVCKFNAIFSEITDLVRGRLESIKFSDL